MKKFFIAAVAALVAVATLSSCAKDNTVIPAALASVEEAASIYTIDLAFDAPQDLTSTVVEFYDEFGQGVATLSVAVADVQNVVFTSETKPTALYTKGLQNVNADGVLPLPETSIATKAGAEPVLLVIR